MERTVQIPDIISAVRDHYIDAYRTAIDAARADDPEIVPELLIEFGGPEISGIYRYWRVDIASKEDGKTVLTEFNQDKFLAFPGASFDIENLHVDLHPMYWNGVEIKATGALPETGQIETWIKGWLDLDDRRPQDGHGLSGVIHNVVPLEATNFGWETSVDFGSADTDAFWLFLKTLAEVGVKHVDVGSFSMMDPLETG